VSFAPRFHRQLPFGVCAAISLPEGDDFPMPDGLHPDEATHARGVPPARRASWVGGRLALRAALSALGAQAVGPILATARGAPVLPSGFVGSISHKRDLAVALAAPAEGASSATLGIDVETPRRFRHDISRHVLTPDERAALSTLEGAARDLEILRRFAAKEAVYKALDPWVRRFVSFQEVALVSLSDGQLDARLTLGADEGAFAVEVHDASDASLILVAARAVRRAVG
jgi:phosphopantetheine--protein transferase-like protein